MQHIRSAWLGAAALVIVTSFAPAAFAATTVNVSLWDKGDMSMDNVDTAHLGLAMGGDMSTATMGVTAAPETVPAGEVTFTAKNDSASTVHEMILAPVVSMDTPLPYDKDTMRVDEEAAHSMGEVSELDPGQSGSLTVTLDPGTYILYCNIPGHYAEGMWTTITVQ